MHGLKAPQKTVLTLFFLLLLSMAFQACTDGGSGGGDSTDEVTYSLMVSAPTDGALTNQNPVRVEGTVEGYNTVTLNGSAVDVRSGVFRSEAELVEGENSLRVVASGRDGRNESETVAVTLDSTAPEVQVQSPAEEEVVTTSRALLQVQTEPNTSVRINGVSFRNEAGAFSREVALPEIGPNAFNIEVIDEAGNVTALLWTITRGFADQDGDGLFDELEIQLGTDPADVDSDGDGQRDGKEYWIDETDPSDGTSRVQGMVLNEFPIFLQDGSVYNWRMGGDGSVENAEGFVTESVRKGALLFVNGGAFPAQTSLSVQDQGRKIVAGPVIMDRFLVWREVTAVSDGGLGHLRFVEVIYNLADEQFDANVSLRLEKMPGAEVTVTSSSTGNETMSTDDDWYVLSSQPREQEVQRFSALHYFSNAGAFTEPTAVAENETSTEVSFSYSVPSMNTARFVHYVVMRAEDDLASAYAETLSHMFTTDLSSRIASNVVNVGFRLDEDKDGLLDTEEEALGAVSTLFDTDSDGLSDGQEVELGTNPSDPDTDDDGQWDSVEVFNGSDPNDGGSLSVDADNDNLSDAREAEFGTDPNNQDTDGDGLFDGVEALFRKTNSLSADTDHDGLTDSEEIDFAEQAQGLELDPLNSDTDDDGLLDGFEVDAGFDPLGANEANEDTDGDGLTNLEEQGFGTNPLEMDTDGDRLSDAFEVVNGLRPSWNIEADLDLDDDGLTTREELELSHDAEVIFTEELEQSGEAGLSPLNPDSDADGLGDGEEENIWGTNPMDGDSDGMGARYDGEELLVDGTDPNDGADDLMVEGFPLVFSSDALIGDENVAWDLDFDGAVGDGTRDAFDRAFRAKINGEFVSGFPSNFGVLSDGIQQTSIGPIFATDDLGRSQGVTLVRKIFVPAARNFARFVEEIRNQTAYPQEVAFEIVSDLGSDASTSILTTGSGDAELDEEDDWVITQDLSESDPFLVFVFSDVDSELQPELAQIVPNAINGDLDTLVVRFRFVLNPYESKSLVHFASQLETLEQAQAEPSNIFLEGLSFAEGLDLERLAFLSNLKVGEDTDGDGLFDIFEEASDLVDVDNFDSDDDALPDLCEVLYGFLPNIDDGEALEDTDEDGETNLSECSFGTNPLNSDTDNDGLLDGEEIVQGSDPLDADSDDDGLLDGQEISLGTRFLVSDTDDDGLLDGEEVRLYGTDPTDQDSDGDTLLDGAEVRVGLDPNVPDEPNADPDGDGLSTFEEVNQLGTNPHDWDTDQDGLSDFSEVIGLFSLVNPDTDGDGRWDGAEFFLDGTAPRDANDVLPEESFVTLPFEFSDDGDSNWIVQETGALLDQSLFDGTALALSLNGKTFTVRPERIDEQDVFRAVVDLEGRRLSVGPFVEHNQFAAVRKMLVSADYSWVRYEDVYKSVADLQGGDIAAQFGLDFRSNSSTQIVATSNRSPTLSRETKWIVIDDLDAAGGAPAVVVVIQGLLSDDSFGLRSSLAGDRLEVRYDFQLPQNTNLRVVYFVAKYPSRARAIEAANGFFDDVSIFEGFGVDELDTLVNW